MLSSITSVALQTTVSTSAGASVLLGVWRRNQSMMTVYRVNLDW